MKPKELTDTKQPRIFNLNLALYDGGQKAKWVEAVARADYDALLVKLQLQTQAKDSLLRSTSQINKRLGESYRREEALSADYDAVMARVEQLEAALAFYADPSIYDAYDNYGEGDVSHATDDNGWVARRALKPETSFQKVDLGPDASLTCKNNLFEDETEGDSK